MIVVIIAGGSGTRLWPLSTPDYPKQLLALTGGETMIQATYARAAQMTSKDKIYIVPDISHAHHIKAQLPDVGEDKFIIEPGRRGTANCIIAALAHVAKRHDAEEPIAFLSADHHVRDVQGFVRSFQVAAQTSAQEGQITLIGIEPTYAATGFGYIEQDGELGQSGNVHRVQSFKEKPDFQTAKRYVAAGGYLWNCGYFVGSVNVFLQEMERSAPSLRQNYETLVGIEDATSDVYDNTYLSFTSEAIDTALIEKAQDLAVVSATFDWMDIGSFRDLHDANESDEFGNHLRGGGIYVDEVENAYVRNEQDEPVVVIGLDNIVVVNTSNGILVARKDLSQRVKDAVKRIEENK